MTGYQQSGGPLLSHSSPCHSEAQPPPKPTGAVVRDVRGAEELRVCQALQRRAWGITEDGYVVPVATMAGAQGVGGSVLGAYLAEQLVGFSFAFLGRLRGEPILYSQLTAVDPDLQGRGIGRLLKREQRRRAAELDLRAVVWAFDPLQAGNARFNLAVLGATSRAYEVNVYGSRSDRLNAGLDTDRLLAEWSTTVSEPPRSDVADGPDLLQAAPFAERSLRHPVAVRQEVLGAPRIRLEIPADLTATKTVAAGEVARAWQRAVRSAFQAAFAAGFVAVGFHRGPPPAYVLERRS